MRISCSFSRIICLFLAFTVLLGLLPRKVGATAAEEPMIGSPQEWNVPTLADTTLRGGRSIIKKTAENWHNYLSVQESDKGLTFTFTKAPATVFEGLSNRVDLNGLCLKFSGYEGHSSSGIFALSFGKGEYDRFAFGLIFDPQKGTVHGAQEVDSALKEVGEPILQDTALTTQGLQGKEWTLEMEKSFAGSYVLTITIGDKGLREEIPQELVETTAFDSGRCCLSLMSVRNLPGFTLTLEGWKQKAVPYILRQSHTLLRGTGNYESTLKDWGKWLTVTEKESGGLRYSFTGAAHSVTEGLTLPLSLEGLRVYFSDLKAEDPAALGRLSLTFGTGAMSRSAFGLLFEFKTGKIYASNPEISNGAPSSGRVVPVGNPLFSGEAFQYANLAGKNWFVDFSLQEDGSYEVAIDIEGQRYVARVEESIVKNQQTFRPDHCYGYLMAGGGNTTLDIDLLAVTRFSRPNAIDNRDLMPAYVPPTESKVDENGTPLWLSSATIMEVNIPEATKEGTLDSALSVLDHAQEMGVNCLWITAIGEPGPKNDGSAGNHYVNLGLQSIDPAITGTKDYEKGWQAFAAFVEEAHKRNIYILFNAVTWGTSPDSPIYKEHPQWYTGSDIWGGKAWDWNNEELIAWYTETLLDIAKTTGIDGILYDCEPEYAGEAVCARFRKAIQDSGRNLVYIAESVNHRGSAYDMELYGVMNYRGYSATSHPIGEHQKNDKEFFTEEGYQIVDAVKNGTLHGTPKQQEEGTGGQYKYYSYCFSNHDSYYFSFQSNLLDFAYQGLFSSYIPIWYLGDEFNSTPSGIRLYFDATKWCNLSTVEHSLFYEEVKEMLRIRRQYAYVLEETSPNHRNANICALETTGDLDLQAYGRYADHTGILIVGNRNKDGSTVSTTITVPFETMGLSQYDRFTLTDLRSGDVLCHGTREQVEKFTVTLAYNELGLYAIEGAGTAAEGLTVPTPRQALLRNGTAHQINTALNSWGSYLQVEESSYGGLTFSFTKAVTTVGEGINIPLSLEDLSLRFRGPENYTNNGSAKDPSRMALSFGPGGYERNSFGLVFDFANGKVYGAKPAAGTTDRLAQDKTPLLDSELLKAEHLEGKEWDLQICRKTEDTYLLTVLIGSSVLEAEINGSYILPTDTFDPTHCYLYFTAAGANPTVTFDFVGWGSGRPIPTYFCRDSVMTQRGDSLLLDDSNDQGLHLKFDSASPLTGIKLRETFILDGTTFYFDDLSGYRNLVGAGDGARFALCFSSPESEDSAFGIAFDPQRGTAYLCINGCLSRELFSHTALTYSHLRDREWSLTFREGATGGMELSLQLPETTLTAAVTQEELASARGFDPMDCRLGLMAWDGPLTCSVRLVGYTIRENRDRAISFFHSLSLESSIAINFMIPQAELADYDSFTLLSSIPVYEGNERKGTQTMELKGELRSNGYYAFTLSDITALQMNDQVEVRLKMTKDGLTYYSHIDSYSIEEYAYKQLNKAVGNTKLKTLCANLLRYGSVAQSWKGYRTDALVDGAMTEEQRALLTDLSSVSFGNSKITLPDLENPAISWKGNTLSLDSKVVIGFIFGIEDDAIDPGRLSLRVSYVNCRGKEETLSIEGATLESAEKGYYIFELDALPASEMRAVVSAVIYEGDTRLSETRQYSIDSYGMGKTGILLTLNQALIAYGDTAKDYFQGG